MSDAVHFQKSNGCSFSKRMRKSRRPIDKENERKRKPRGRRRYTWRISCELDGCTGDSSQWFSAPTNMGESHTPKKIEIETTMEFAMGLVFLFLFITFTCWLTCCSGFIFSSQFRFVCPNHDEWFLGIGDGGRRHTHTHERHRKTSEWISICESCTCVCVLCVMRDTHKVYMCCRPATQPNQNEKKINKTKRNRKINLWNYCPTFYRNTAHREYERSVYAAIRCTTSYTPPSPAQTTDHIYLLCRVL